MRYGWLVALGALWGCTETTELLAPVPVSCLASVPPVHLGGTDDESCAAVQAAKFGRYALCVCEDVATMGGLSVRGLSGSGDAGGVPAAVGVNENLSVAGPLEAPGVLRVAGLLNLAGGRVEGNLHARYTVSTSAQVAVGGDLFTGGDVKGPYSVSGTLRLPSIATIASEVYAPRVVREAVSVPDPCSCDLKPLFNIATAVAARATQNANDLLTFASALSSEITEPRTFDWPCGEFHLAELRTSRQAPLEFRIHGHVGIFVDGDVRLGNNLEVILDPNASLDLVVGGSFVTQGRLFGSPKMPRRMRLWVGEVTVSLPDEIQFGGIIYAPRAAFTAGVGLLFSGSLFVSTLAINGDIGLTYDPAVADEGQICGVAPPPLIQ
ncbi:MAG TPA: hypothetical protein VHU40_20235 [Polyangia bacterium]|nr:hypothetical protein [Polyangia bacterium]